jgi:hypothetical protein
LVPPIYREFRQPPDTAKKSKKWKLHRIDTLIDAHVWLSEKAHWRPNVAGNPKRDIGRPNNSRVRIGMHGVACPGDAAAATKVIEGSFTNRAGQKSASSAIL